MRRSASLQCDPPRFDAIRFASLCFNPFQSVSFPSHAPLSAGLPSQTPSHSPSLHARTHTAAYPVPVPVPVPHISHPQSLRASRFLGSGTVVSRRRAGRAGSPSNHAAHGLQRSCSRRLEAAGVPAERAFCAAVWNGEWFEQPGSVVLRVGSWSCVRTWVWGVLRVKDDLASCLRGELVGFALCVFFSPRKKKKTGDESGFGVVLLFSLN